MLYRKEGYPEENSIVLCTVTKVLPHSVFVRLDEFGGKSGMIHISEISPGRIRNIRDYVKEDKVIVCKVLKINEERGHIDLSLRRVSEGQRREKADEIKQEQMVEKIMDFVAKKHKLDAKKIYIDFYNKIKDDYGTPYAFLEAFIEGEVSLDELGLDKAVLKDLEEVVRQRIKPPEVFIKGELKLTTYDPDGVDLIRKSVAEAEKTEDVDIRYKGAGKFNVGVRAGNYKDAEAIMKESMDSAINFITKKGGEGSFERIEE